MRPIKHLSNKYNNQSACDPFNHHIQALQNDISQLQNKFLRWKIVYSEFNSNHSFGKSFLPQQINHKIQEINEKINSLIHKFEKELRQTEANCILMIEQHKIERSYENGLKKDNPMDYITSRLLHFERCLKQHQDKQQKLIKTINALLIKYNVNEDLHFISNDPELRNKIVTSQVSQLTFNQSIKNTTTLHEPKDTYRSRLPAYQTTELEKKRKKLHHQKDNNHVRAYQSQSPLQFRNTPKQGLCGKISLKMCLQNKKRSMSPLMMNHNNPNRLFRQNSWHKQLRSESTEAHDHRFMLMMHKLHQ